MDLRDSPCIFSGSNGHVPPLIEGGRGVELPGEIRGNELKVTRTRETLSLSLSFPPYTSRLSCGHHPRAPTELLTTTPSISPPSDNRVVNHHARHQYHRNQHALVVAIQIKKNRKEKETEWGRITTLSVWIRLFPQLGSYIYIYTHTHDVYEDISW